MTDELKLEIEYVKVSELVPYARNSKIHDSSQVRAIANSMEEFGMCDPIGVWTNGDGELEIVEGHGRVLALDEIGEETAPIFRLDHLTDEQRRAYSHVHNQTNALTGFNDLLSKDLDELDFQWEDFGFGKPEGDESDQEIIEIVEDDEPDDVEKRCEPGDLWLLGGHRLLCGDSTDPDSFARLMGGEVADMVFTSPPYNGGGTTLPTKHLGKGVKDVAAKKFYEGYSDNRGSREYIEFASSVLDLCFAHTDGFVFWNVNYNANSRFEYIAQIVGKLPNLIELVIWDKTNAIPQKGTFARVVEPIFVFSTNGETIPFEKATRNLWTIDSAGANQEFDHRACFPVGLPAKGIGLVPNKSGIVLEPFCGSGTTLIAAEQLGRKCYGIELDPHYCDIILQRWEDFTGEKAKKL